MAITPEQRQEWAKRYGQVVAKAWADPAFKQRLLADPVAVLREHGLEMPTDREVRAVENTDEVIHLVVPAPPKELTDEQLGAVAGGGGGGYPCAQPCCGGGDDYSHIDYCQCAGCVRLN
jgi:hypothetical protein